MNADAAAQGDCSLSVLIRRWRDGDLQARDRLTEYLLPIMRQLAVRELRRQAQPLSLQVSDLVQDAMIELLKRGCESRDSAHLRALSASVLRTTLVDHLRTRNAQKRGTAHRVHVSLSTVGELPANTTEPVDLLALSNAVDSLNRESPRAAAVVEMRIFGGMTEGEIATALNVSRPTVTRDWVAAKLWLARQLVDTTHASAMKELAQ